MKKYIYTIIAAVAMLSLAGCSLEEYNPSSASADSEWTSLAGYEKKVNDCYFDFIRVVYGQAEDTFVPLSECGTDLWGYTKDVNANSSNGWCQVATYTSFGASTGMLSEGYAGFYGTLSACNAAIAYASKVERASEEAVNALAAEAHYLRAHSLFNIVEFWGGKYLPTGLLEAALIELPSSSVNDFYDVILKDLEFAMKYLPVKQEVTGHVTRAAAYHLYAKACLTYSTYTDGLAGATPLTSAESQELLGKAKDAADYLINNSSALGVSLYSDIEDVFADKNNKNNKEALFVVTHSSITALNPRGNYFNRCWKHMCTWNANSTDGLYMDCLKQSYATEVDGVAVEPRGKGNAYYAPTMYLLKLYGENDGRYKAFFRDYFTNNSGDYLWSAADVKRQGLSEARIGNPDYKIPTGDTCIFISKKSWTQAEKEAVRYAVYNVEDNYDATGAPIASRAPSLKKADYIYMYGGSNPGKPYTWADCIVYRLAETYLLSAEIEHRLGNDAGAASRINVIRDRANVKHDGSMNITAAQVNDTFLLEEEARELCGEWNRWTTLKRFRAFETQLRHNSQITAFNKDVHYLRPVPLAEINKIDNKEEYQNPGY